MTPFETAQLVAPWALTTINVFVERWSDKRLKASSTKTPPEPLELRVVTSSGDRVCLGASVESAESISANPVLVTEAVTLVGKDGARFHIAAGQKLRIAKVPGAERPVRSTVTTETGIEQRYGFEVQANRTLWVLANREDRASDGPFRNEASVALLPYEADLIVASDRAELIKAMLSSDIIVAAWLGIPAALLCSVSVYESWWAGIWWVGMAAGVFWLLLCLAPNRKSSPAA